MPRNDRTHFLLYMAMADAYGMAYEFAEDIAAVGKNDLTYRQKPGYPDYQTGHYTDDTQMSIGNAEALLRAAAFGETGHLEARDFAMSWVRIFQRDPRVGYSKRMYNMLSASRTGDDLISLIVPTSTFSGAAMRAGPVGLLPDVEEVKRIAELQASVTHNTDEGLVSAQAAALAVHYMHYGIGKKADLPGWLETHLGADWCNTDMNDKENGLAIMIRGLDAVMAADTLSSLLRYCVDLGSGQDTDTICTIAMAIASRSDEFEDDLPQSLFEGLENAKYGRGYLTRMDEIVLRSFPGHCRAAPTPVSPVARIPQP